MDNKLGSWLRATGRANVRVCSRFLPAGNCRFPQSATIYPAQIGGQLGYKPRAPWKRKTITLLYVTSRPVVSAGARMTSVEDLHQLYDSPSAVAFDSVVHGDGELHVHYGLYQPGSESTKEATHATVALMARLLQTVGGVTLTPRRQILDLGSGLGGPMHQVVASSGCQAVCLNLCETQNETNRKQLARLGLDAKITVVKGDMRELPSAWTETFDVVWSQDAFYHNEEKSQILHEAYKVLKPGAILVFTDILAADDCSQLNVRSCLQRNRATALGTQGMYTTLLQQAHFEVLVFHDLSSYMSENFIHMARSIEVNEQKLQEAGISAKYLQDYQESVKNSVQEAEEGSLRWGVFVCKKLEA